MGARVRNDPVLSAEACGLVQGEYIETHTNGSLPGVVTCAAADVPSRLTARSPDPASSMDFTSIHSYLSSALPRL